MTIIIGILLKYFDFVKSWNFSKNYHFRMIIDRETLVCGGVVNS